MILRVLGVSFSRSVMVSSLPAVCGLTMSGPQVSSEFIKVFDPVTSESLAAVVYDSITKYAMSGTSSKSKDHIVLYVQDANDKDFNVEYVYTFKLGERATSIVDSQMGPALEAHRKEMEARALNPFHGIGKRIPPPGNLFRRQIHRSDLKAIHVCTVAWLTTAMGAAIECISAMILFEAAFGSMCMAHCQCNSISRLSLR